MNTENKMQNVDHAENKTNKLSRIFQLLGLLGLGYFAINQLSQPGALENIIRLATMGK